METFLIRALQLILSLSILVFIHELGHFLFARLFKVRVDKFYLFFNVNFSLVRAKKIDGKWQIKFLSPNVPLNERPRKDAFGNIMTDEKGKALLEPIPLDELEEGDWRKYPETTEWGIGWLPLGGYCKIVGMVDESMDTAQLAEAPKPWEYRARPIWQRFPIITGGVLFNFILAIIIYTGLLFANGKEYFPIENAKYGLEFTPTMVKNGFQSGDKILSLNGEKPEDFNYITQALILDGKRDVKILRNNEIVDIVLPEDFAQQVIASKEMPLFDVRFPFVIKEVMAGSPASRAKLQEKDSVIGINGKEVFIFQDIVKELAANANTSIELDFVREGEKKTAKLEVSQDGKLGVYPMPFFAFFKTEHTKYNLLEAIPAGTQYGWEILKSYVKQFKLVFTKEGAKQMGGFGTIAKLFPKKWDWTLFWSMTAFISVILAFMNILPIPGLDGGHMMFLLYELIMRRKPSEKFMERAQTVGFLLLISLVLYANGNDIIKAFFSK